MNRNRLATVRACLRQLELEPGARWGEVRRAYRTMAQVWHPDRFSQGTELHRTASERLKEITSAYRWLREHRDLLGELEPQPAEPEPETPADEGPSRQRAKWTFGRGAAFRPRREPSPERPDGTVKPPLRAPLYRSPQAWALLAALIVGAVFVLNEAGYSILPSRTPAARPTPPVDLFVQASDLRVQRSPMEGSPTVGFLRRGQQVRVTDTYENWRRLVAVDDSLLTLGWIVSEAVAQEPPPPVTADPLPEPSDEPELLAPDEEPVITFAAPELSPAEILPVDPGEHEPRWGDTYWGLQRPPTEALDTTPTGWERIEHWIGEDPVYTEPFHPTGDRWRLAWRVWGTGSATLELYEAETRRPVTVRELLPSDTTSYLIMEGAGSYYLQLWPTDVSWLLAVESER